MRKHLVLVGILGLALGLAGFAQQYETTRPYVTTVVAPKGCIETGRRGVTSGGGCYGRELLCDAPHVDGIFCAVGVETTMDGLPTSTVAQLPALTLAQSKELHAKLRAAASTPQPSAKPKITVRFKHAMGMPCKGDDPVVCHLTVEDIRLDEKNPNHESVNLSTDKQDSLHISGEKPFTVEFVSDDNGPAPFYRPMGKAAKVFASGPARPEASGHKYHMVIRDEEGAVDPHIFVCKPGVACD
jgi:hypothetical protein